MTTPRFILRAARLCRVSGCDRMLQPGAFVDVIDGHIVCAPCWRTS